MYPFNLTYCKTDGRECVFSFRFQKDVFFWELKFKLFDLDVYEELLFFTCNNKYFRYVRYLKASEQSILE
jgi:hypothetical protein